MTSRRYPLALLALLASGLVMAGCSGKSTTHPQASSVHGTTAGAATSPHRTGAAAAARPGGAPAAEPLPDNTGIPTCDDFLASYVACHRAAAVYAPDQIEPRYQEMRTSLLRDSQNPAVRPQLGARCTALATQLRQALHGKSCATVSPAATSSSH